MKVLYTDKDQETINKAQDVIRFYEESLMQSLSKSMSDKKEIKSLFIGDFHRRELYIKMTEMMSRMIPAYIIKFDNLDRAKKHCGKMAGLETESRANEIFKLKICRVRDKRRRT